MSNSSNITFVPTLAPTFLNISTIIEINTRDHSKTNIDIIVVLCISSLILMSSLAYFLYYFCSMRSVQNFMSEAISLDEEDEFI